MFTFLEAVVPKNPMTALLCSAILSSIIGIERDMHGRPTGLRTNLVVALGATLFTIISLHTGKLYGGDTGRIAAQVVSGIGFLGAGVIIQSGLSVRGLTSAASLWLVAAIGMACGFYLYTYALVTTILGLICLAFLGKVENSYPRTAYRKLSVLGDQSLCIGDIRDILTSYHYKIQQTDYHLHSEKTTEIIISVKFKIRKEDCDKGPEIIRSIKTLRRDVQKISWVSK